MNALFAVMRRLLERRPAVPLRLEYLETRLKDSLQGLAMPATVQLQLYPTFVSASDELALEFDNWRAALSSNARLSALQKANLDGIDAALSEMSCDETLWSDDALRDRNEWERVRTAARQALDGFGWPIERPASYVHEHVRGHARI